MPDHRSEHQFSLDLRPDELARLRKAGELAPTQPVPIVRLSPQTGKRELVRVRWGLVPSFVGDPSQAPGLIHARAEMVDRRIMFRAAFRERRCLIPADGFPVWERTEARSRRSWIRHRDPDRLLPFAGIWEVWTPRRRTEEGGLPEVLESCVMITVPANELVGRFQERMPAILEPGEWKTWLDPATEPADAKALLRPYPAEELRVVSDGR